MFKYFDGELPAGFVALYSGRMIQAVSEGLTGLFLPIFLLKFFNFNVQHVFLYYLSGFVLYFLFLPFGVQLLNKIGLRRSLRISVVLGTAVTACYFFAGRNPLMIYLVLSIIFLTLYRIFFWVPYHTDFAKFSNRENRAKEFSIMEATRGIISIVTPVVAGFIIANFGFSSMFAVAMTVYISTLIPFATLPRTQERFSWTVKETLSNFFAKSNRKLVLSNIANGAESMASAVLWPLFIWQVLAGNYFAIGAVSSLITLAAVVIQLVAGKYADKLNKRKMLHWGSVLYSFGWLAKIYVLTGYHIFVVGTYHNFAGIFKDTPFEALNYDLLADQGHYVDEFTVLKEMAIQIGKILILSISFLMIGFVDINWTFILAAIASLCINFL